jgi:predicted TIM-barrel fold metal-dependent hydrolase
VGPPNPEWLAQRSEPVIEPDLEVVDAHHHFSDRAARPYLLDSFLADLGSGHRVSATVFIEGRMRDAGGDELERGIAETVYVCELAALADRLPGVTGVCAGIVANVDLCQGARTGAALETQREVACGRLRGVRQIAPWDAAPELNSERVKIPRGLFCDAAFRAGFARLAPLGLSFEAWLYYPQYDEMVSLARAFPLTQVVLDFPVPLSLGPYDKDSPHDHARWRAAIHAVAAEPNIAVKLGGLGMALCGFDFFARPTPPSSEELAAAWRPYFEECLHAFGAGRCLLGSNFPVDKASYSYRVFWNAAKRLTGSMSPADRSALLSGNARRYYRL